MKHLQALIIIVFGVLVGSTANALMIMSPVEPKTGIEIVYAYAYATPQTNPAAAILMTVHNHDSVADKMVGFVLGTDERTELHTMTMENDIMRMRKVDGYELGGNKTLSLTPMGNHIMVFNRAADWNAGDVINATAVFEKAGEIPVVINVLARGEKPMADHDNHSMHHGHH